MRMYNTELANKSYLFRISILPLHSSQKLKTIDFSEKLSTQKSITIKNKNGKEKDKRGRKIVATGHQGLINFYIIVALNLVL